ncbi:hypothetical protein LSAT2_020565, partial [Lamellibrachia satsuma]
CSIGSHEPIRCLSGTYQDETAQALCKTCPAGFFCDNTFAPVVLFNDSHCPEGYYCPLGTEYATQFRCPRGTFANYTGLQNVSDCQPCPGGFYCDEEAQVSYSKVCPAGFYCRQYASSATPNQGQDADVCPSGHYCPAGTAEPEKCPPGTFSSATGLSDVDQCLNCTQGYYCLAYNLTATTGPCWAGYYCPLRATQPDEIVCPAGHYCPNISYVPTPCP